MSPKFRRASKGPKPADNVPMEEGTVKAYDADATNEQIVQIFHEVDTDGR